MPLGWDFKGLWKKKENGKNPLPTGKKNPIKNPYVYYLGREKFPNYFQGMGGVFWVFKISPIPKKETGSPPTFVKIR